MAKRRRRKPYLKNSLFKFRLKKEAVYTLAAIFLATTSALILFSQTRQGLFLTKLNLLFTRYFGWASLLVSFILFLLALLLANFKFKISKPNVLAGFSLIFFSLIGLTRAGLVGQKLYLLVFGFLPVSLGVIFVFLALFLTGAIIAANTSLAQSLAIAAKFFHKYFISGWASLFKKISPKVSPKNDQPDFIVSQPVAPGLTSETLEEPRVLTGQDEPAPKPSLLPEFSPGQELSDALLNHPQDLGIWEYPDPRKILVNGAGQKADRGDLKKSADLIEKTLESFGISPRVVEVNLGPAVTQYALEIPLGTKLSKITSLSNDLALALAAPTGQIRIEAPIPGRNLVGVEVPNRSAEFVTLKQIMTSEAMQKNQSRLSFSLGLNVSGVPVITDLARMPHLLIAGQTGSGKSICINSILCSLLFRNSPAELRLILVDPKRVELTHYHNIPHLLVPVIVDLEKILSSLKWTLKEMENRYKLFARSGVRNIVDYNQMAGFQALPYIVIVIDELADVIMFAPVEVEDAITRIAQMARATGIHLIVSTQRPSVNVLTGLIKANIPARIAFAVTSNVDSRVIIDQPGAEKLLGSGDMLFIPPTQSKPQRLQGTFVSDRDVKTLVRFLKKQSDIPVFEEEILSMPLKGSSPSLIKTPGIDIELDSLFEDSVALVTRADKASASLLQRKLSIGYARAARILDQLHELGVVGPADGSKPREVLARDPDVILARFSPAKQKPQDFFSSPTSG